MHGWRATLGVLYPVTGTTTLAEWHAWAPSGVAFAPVPFEIVDVLPHYVADREEDLARSAALLRSAKLDALVQVGTPFGFVAGLTGDDALNKRLEAEVCAPATSMMRACSAALKHLGIKRPLVVTAYVDELNDLLVQRLSEDGIEPASMHGLGLSANLEINRLSSSVAYRTASAAYDVGPQGKAAADGIFIVCGGLATFDVIDVLEQDTGLPVVTSNSAGLWAGLNLARVSSRIDGLGRLFSGHGRRDGE